MWKLSSSEGVEDCCAVTVDVVYPSLLIRVEGFCVIVVARVSESWDSVIVSLRNVQGNGVRGKQ